MVLEAGFAAGFEAGLETGLGVLLAAGCGRAAAIGRTLTGAGSAAGFGTGRGAGAGRAFRLAPLTQPSWPPLVGWTRYIVAPDRRGRQARISTSAPCGSVVTVVVPSLSVSGTRCPLPAGDATRTRHPTARTLPSP